MLSVFFPRGSVSSLRNGVLPLNPNGASLKPFTSWVTRSSSQEGARTCLRPLSRQTLACHLILDVHDSAKLQSFAAEITGKYRALNVLIIMAGIMKPEDLVDFPRASTIDDTIATNLTAPLQLTAALLPHLKQQQKATVMTVTSRTPRRKSVPVNIRIGVA
jgi:NAD(P)-dependent dehydrogenase (short-subunit alcohol dehydrogenase family)